MARTQIAEASGIAWAGVAMGSGLAAALLLAVMGLGGNALACALAATGLLLAGGTFWLSSRAFPWAVGIGLSLSGIVGLIAAIWLGLVGSGLS